MYAWLRQRFPRPLADILMAAWLVALLLAVLYFALEPRQEFIYQNL